MSIVWCGDKNRIHNINRVWLHARIATTLIIVIASILLVSSAHATRTYAKQTGQLCAACHIDPVGGGTLTATGIAFAASDYHWPPAVTQLVEPPSPQMRLLTLALGFIHLAAAIIWFGTIFYVHIVLRPRYALGGLPKSELRLAWVCILLLGATGIPLTVLRFPKFVLLATTVSGKLLLVKVALYLFMVCTAAFVTLFVGPRLRKLKKGWSENAGKDGKSAWVRIGENIYDLTGSIMWKEGNHMRRHQAGQDLTEALKGAPHGSEKLQGFSFFRAEKTSPEHAPVARVFYALAYMNLFVALGILVIIALRRWA